MPVGSAVIGFHTIGLAVMSSVKKTPAVVIIATRLPPKPARRWPQVKPGMSPAG
jgi:hypothetical protein